jgi:hypothetical protein
MMAKHGLREDKAYERKVCYRWRRIVKVRWMVRLKERKEWIVFEEE